MNKRCDNEQKFQDIARISESLGFAISEILRTGHYISGAQYGVDGLVRDMKKYRSVFGPLLRERFETHPTLEWSGLELFF